MDACKVREIVSGSYVQENGIVRNHHGWIIARLCDGVAFDNFNEIGKPSCDSSPSASSHSGDESFLEYLTLAIKEINAASASIKIAEGYLHTTHVDGRIIGEVKEKLWKLSDMLEKIAQPLDIHK